MFINKIRPIKLFCNISQKGLSSIPPRLSIIRVRKKSVYRKRDNMLTFMCSIFTLIEINRHRVLKWF